MADNPLPTPAEIEKKIEEFSLGIRRGKISGSYSICEGTAKIIIDIIRLPQWQTAKSLLDLTKKYGRKLASDHPLEISISNTIRRILHLIREEYRMALSAEVTEDGMRSDSLDARSLRMSSNVVLSGSSDKIYADQNNSKLLAMSRQAGTGNGGFIARQPDNLGSSGMLKVFAPTNDFSLSARSLQERIIGNIEEWLVELANAGSSIGSQAMHHIHASEIIMTYGSSRTVEQFLGSAAVQQKRKFEVVCVQTSPSNAGHEMAANLMQLGIEVCIITDSAVFAIMARVHKVIVGTHAVMANGGLIAINGTHMIAAAAKHYSVPFVVCTGLHKLSPVFAHDQDGFNELKSPSEVLPYEKARSLGVTVSNPAWDYIPPELINLYITNSGSYAPSYIYHLLSEFYHPEDLNALDDKVDHSEVKKTQNSGATTSK